MGGFDGCWVTFLTFSFHYYEHYDRLCYSICIYMYIYIQGRVGVGGAGGGVDGSWMSFVSFFLFLTMQMAI